ncbi:Solitary outer membrane autotransporter beta-barrel domain [Pseudoalteromonas gelatinilytica]|nr:Solitary outer membrane autotransporter beta-barrel domain [Pseudoalteromonas profundi]
MYNNVITCLTVCILMTCFFCVNSYANPTKQLETAFATSLVLTDGDSITLGFGDFDPQTLFDPQHASKDEDSIALRKELKLYSIPYTWQLDEPIYQHQLSVTGRISYLNQSDFISLYENVADDYISETVYNGMIGFNAEKALGSKWSYQFGFNTHYLHYNNDYDYNSSESRRDLQPLADNLYTNLNSNALVLNPNATMIYRLPRYWGYYEYKLNFNYYYGWALSHPDGIHNAAPETWRTLNGIKAKFNMFKIGPFEQAFYIKGQRIDLGGDSRVAFGTDHFYEYGIGFLWDTRKWTSWFDNFGVGINIHNGSSLDGAAIVLYFNEI